MTGDPNGDVQLASDLGRLAREWHEFEPLAPRLLRAPGDAEFDAVRADVAARRAFWDFLAVLAAAESAYGADVASAFLTALAIEQRHVSTLLAAARRLDARSREALDDLLGEDQ